MTETNQSWLIEHGHIVDPRQRIDRVGRLLIAGGIVAAVDLPADGGQPRIGWRASIAGTHNGSLDLRGLRVFLFSPYS